MIYCDCCHGIHKNTNQKNKKTTTKTQKKTKHKAEYDNLCSHHLRNAAHWRKQKGAIQGGKIIEGLFSEGPWRKKKVSAEGKAGNIPPGERRTGTKHNGACRQRSHQSREGVQVKRKQKVFKGLDGNPAEDGSVRKFPKTGDLQLEISSGD